MHLPQELVDHILDYLADDHATLRACARVSQPWLPSSRRHLFAKISLKATSPHNGPADPQARCQRLYKVLQRTPEVITNIRTLEICEGSPLHHHYSHFQGSTTWVTTERTLTALLRSLTNVRRFEFAATSTLYWTLLPPTFQVALCGLLSLPSLVYVRLHSWMFPNFAALTGILSHCRNLQAFALSSTNVGAEGFPDLSVDTACVQGNEGGAEVAPLPLEALMLDFVTFPYLDHWLLGQGSLVDIRRLRELRVAHFHDAHVVETLLLAVGGSLENFHLKPGSWNVHPFNLSHNSGLRSIRITLDDPETAMSWATSILTTLTAGCNTALTSIGLEFYADPKKINGWAELDALFMRPALASLHQVEIGLFAIPAHVDFISVKDEMRGLGKREIVRWYQLGVKSQRSSRQLTPRISTYES
ncbi:hypothetical protein BDN70DRAFT_895767 [Pholiota conissans]|uniref:F-box domain-containing protein n=1 Tax=Pholiota conissans TaxID=109636 RepID=A0A9P6CSL5_9AGAR|nr:hypothetical protein BDN70DRAFT_895767 [Pholiota conissans]